MSVHPVVPGTERELAEVLTELCAKFKDESARRLLAEVRWWRDNAYRIPWVHSQMTKSTDWHRRCLRMRR